jgi:hypothetical protein
MKQEGYRLVAVSDEDQVRGQLLDWLKQAGRRRGCAELHLDSRLHREAAHRFYEREGLAKTCYHFAAAL